MWLNESVRETESDPSSWTNMNPWSNINTTRSGTTTTSRSNGSQSSMTQSQGYSSVPMRQPSRSWDLHTHQQYNSGMTSARWGSNSNWSAANEGCTPTVASLNSPVKGSSDIWGPPQQQQQQQQSQWNSSMVNGTEAKRNPGVLHRSMTGPSQNWGHKVDQQTPWDMGSANEQQQAAAAAAAAAAVTATHDWNNAQKWNSQQQQQPQQYAWHQTAENSPEWGNGNAHHELGWNGGNPSEETVTQESGSPGAWPVKQMSEPEIDHGSNGNTDMVWQDPNPKMKLKKIARDTGTAIWGDPESQKTISTIRHWKNPEAAAASAYPKGLENDWTTVEQTLQPENGWGEPSINQSKMWSIANAWSDLQDDSIPDMIIPKLSHALGSNTLLETLQNAATANPHLASQLSEQFQGAVNRNWINQGIYTAQVVPHFATLHQLIKRMYKKESEVLQLRHHPPTQTTNSCKERILSEIQHTKNELAEIQRAICGMPPPPVTTASTPSDGQSRLQQWKKNGNAMAKHVELVNGRNNQVASSLPCDSDAMMNSLINAAHHLSINAGDNSLNNSWKQGSLEWSPPATRDDRRKSSEESRLSSVTSQLNADVQEFIPGKRWEYRDPNKMSDDPNATPGSCKPDPLLTSAALRLQMNSSTTKDSISSSSNSLTQNGWNARMSSKQISNISPMMSPNGEQPGVNENYIYLPHCWLLFQLDNNITEHQFQQVCHHAGHMINFCMIGLKIACVKFNSNNVDLVIHRIKSEYQFNPEQFRIVSDEEFNNKMLKHTRYLPGNGYDSLSQQQHHHPQHHQHQHQQHHQQQHQPPQQQQQQMMSHHSAPWNFVPQMYNDPTCQY